MEIINMIDNGILNFIHANMHHAFLDTLMTDISFLGNYGAIWIFFCLILLIFSKSRKVGLEMGMALILCLLIGNLGLKPLVARARPFTVNTDFLLLIKAPADFSFPSGHSMSSFAAASVIWLENKKCGIAAIIFAALIAFSRLYLYVHYPTDVIAGIIIGVIIAVLSVGLIDRLYNKKQVKQNEHSS